MLEKSSFTRKILQEKLFFSPLPATWGEGGRCGISEKCRIIGEVKKKIVLREKGEALLAFSLRSRRKELTFFSSQTLRCSNTHNASQKIKGRGRLLSDYRELALRSEELISAMFGPKNRSMYMLYTPSKK